MLGNIKCGWRNIILNKNARQLITSGGMGTMGFGIPAAIGAKLAQPNKNVIVFVGDGGFQMTNQELALLNGYGIAIKVVLINNHSLGMVRQWQESFYEERRSQSVFDVNPIFNCWPRLMASNMLS
ncbi:Acetolactate synthase large subunit [Lactococcus lactis]|nr:Acetolactate synthase large subunit [Lactococcus lactis]